eukprot:GEMP01039470.1.p1 GENE.GEMP01039470.1~~GEMP01039470.1.p1  ORF type:complete len:253 (+),score=40.13 GEMP01039470.1:75-833(+)
MGGSVASRQHLPADANWTAMELYNLKQVYYFMCLHQTTLTSCPLTASQWDSLLHHTKSAKLAQKTLWRHLFQAICYDDATANDTGLLKNEYSGELTFPDFLRFIRFLKRGMPEERRWFCFQCWDTDHDGIVERADFKRVVDAKAILSRQIMEVEDEVSSFFALVDEKSENRFDIEAFENYCSVYGDGVVTSTLKIFEMMFDQCIDETGISITNTDVKNSKPHIDWQDHKIKMSGLLCCSTITPTFTRAPVIA